MSKMRKDEAVQLWDRLAEAFTNAEQAIIEIIEKKAWEPLGYKTFCDAWTDRMEGVPLATTQAKAYVVYQMLDEGMAQHEIAASINGVGPRETGDLARQKGNKVSAKNASPRKRANRGGPTKTKVREHEREAPGERRTVHVEMSPRDYAYLEKIAKREGVRVSQLAATVLTGYMDRTTA